VIAENEDDLIKRLKEWKDSVENTGIRVNMNKTKVMINYWGMAEGNAEGCKIIKMAMWCLW